MFFGKKPNIKNKKFTLFLVVSIVLFAFFIFVIDSMKIVFETNKNNFAYTIKIRDIVEEIDKIIERAEVNLNVFADIIVQSYDITQLKNEKYNYSYIKKVDLLAKSILKNAPMVDAVWFQLNSDLPFAAKVYTWNEVKDGKIINLKKHPSDRKINIKEDPYYFKAVNAHKAIWSDVYKDVDTKVLMITVAQPVYKKNELIGVVGIDISIENLKQTLKNMQSLSPGSEIFLLDNNKNIVLEQLTNHDATKKGHYDFLYMLNSQASPNEKMVEYDDAGTKKTAIMLELSNKYNVVITFSNKLIFQGFARLFRTIYFLLTIMMALTIVSLFHRHKIAQLYKAIQKEVAAIRNIINYSPTVMCHKDNKGRYSNCNDKFARLVGLTKEEVIGKTDYDLFDKKMADMIINIDAEVMQKKEYFINYDWRVGQGDEETVMETHVLPLLGEENEVLGLFVNAIDRTQKDQEQKQLEKAKEIAEKAVMMKNSFLANMSHEIRTPMNGVFGFLQLLESTNPTEEQKELIADAQKSSEILLHVINEILDFSKIEANKLIIEKSSFDLRALIEDVTIMNTPTAYRKGLEINSLICSNIPMSVIGDSGRVKQILNNLVSNAIKFTHEGGVVIYVNQLLDDENKTTLRFIVKDSGIGISEDKLKLIFESFTQADASTTRKYGGTGLGLAISEKLAVLMKGNIHVESSLDKGSTFILTLPFEKDKAPNPVIETSRNCLNGTKILIADDNLTDLKILRYYLYEANCCIEEANYVQDVINIINKEDNDLSAIIIESKLQNEGEILLSDLIKCNEYSKNIPLILYTSLINRDEILESKEMGFVGAITKPVKKQELVEVVATALNVKNNKIEQDVIIENSSKKNKFDIKTKILLVEDTELNCKFIEKFLNNFGLSCEIVNNGEAAISVFSPNKYDLILMDCQMPIMDGYSATKEIRRIEDGISHTPIIALTANVMKADRDKCYQAGMDDYVSKPIDAKKLLSLIEKYVAKQTVEDAEVELASIPKDSFRDNIVEKMVDEFGFTQSEAFELFEEFLKFLAESIINLEIALNENKFETLKALAHKLKGASANLKIETVRELSTQLEKAILVEDKEFCQSIIFELKNSLEYLESLNIE